MKLRLARRHDADTRKPHALIVVQNLPVPLDRRVWLEANALRTAGYDVTVICPKGPGDKAREVINDIVIHKYRPAPEAAGIVGYVVEFVYCWLRTAWLSVVVWGERPFDVLQACNPPDTYWLLALLWRVRGVKFVYDQHDLNPELYLSRFGQPQGSLAKAELAGLLWLERMTYRFAHHVLSTNESYRALAVKRGNLPLARTSVVRSGPDTTVMRPVVPSPDLREGNEFLLAYLGIMGPQDGVEHLIEVMDELVLKRGRTDVKMVLLGFGDCLESLKTATARRGLSHVMTFTGRVGPTEIAQYLSGADLGVGPDLKTPLNDVSTMNKTMEYMAFCLPSISFDLVETRISAGDSGLYVPSGDIVAFADAVEDLLADDERRIELGRMARERVVSELDWQPQSRTYVRAFDQVLGIPERPSATELPTTRPGLQTGLEPIDLTDPFVVRSFIRDRGRITAGASGASAFAGLRTSSRDGEGVVQVVG